MALIHPRFVEGLNDKNIQNLLVLSIAAGAISSVAAYWAWADVKGQTRLEPLKAVAKATGVGVAVLIGTAAYETWMIERAQKT